MDTLTNSYKISYNEKNHKRNVMVHIYQT